MNGARLCLSALPFRALRPVDCETFWTEVDDYTGFLSDVYEMPARSNLSQWLLALIFLAQLVETARGCCRIPFDRLNGFRQQLLPV